MRVIAILFCLLTANCIYAPQTATHVRGTVAITIDDAPKADGPHFTGAERADAIVDAYASTGAPPMAFFVTTKPLDTEEGRQRIQTYADAGHLIANHTRNHPWASSAGLEVEIAEIDAAEAALEGYPNRRPWFRFPYLDEGSTFELRDGIRAALSDRGLRNGYVTIDNYDWYLANKWQQAHDEGRSVDLDALKNAYIEMLVDALDFYDQVAIDAFGETAPHVLLLHENDLAGLFIDDLVEAFRNEGWEIISPDEAYAHKVAQIEPKTLKTRSGHFTALAIEAGRAPETMDNPAINEPALDALLERHNVFGP